MSNQQTQEFNEHQQERIQELSKELQAAGWLVIEAQQRLNKVTQGFKDLPTYEEMLKVDPQAFDAPPVEVLDASLYTRFDQEEPIDE